MTPDAPLVSVIVPTRDSAATIRACLQSVRAQTYPHLELFVVDNHSTDGTPQIASAFTHLVLQAGPERSAQRNLGARRSRGRYLAFIDSDMILRPDVIAACVAQAAMADAVVVPERSVGVGYWASCRALERSCYLGDDTIEAARFFERDLFFAAGAYDERLPAGEDWDLQARVRALGGRVSRADSMIDHDEGRLTLRRAASKKFYYGATIGRYVQKHPRNAQRQLVLVRPAFIRHRRRLLRRPNLLVGIIALKSIEFGAAAAGALIAALRRKPAVDHETT